MVDQELDYENQYIGFNKREKEIFIQGFTLGHLRGFVDGEAKQAVFDKKARKRFVSDLLASWKQPIQKSDQNKFRQR